MKLFKKLAVTLAIILPVCSFAQREYIDDPALHVHEPMDELVFKHEEISAVRGKSGIYEGYWEILGPYVNNETVGMRRMLFFVDCNSAAKPLNVALSTIALGDDRGNMIKIYLIPPGTEEWMQWTEVSFIQQEHISKICK